MITSDTADGSWPLKLSRGAAPRCRYIQFRSRIYSQRSRWEM
jgi:hypothetical protein